MIDTAAVAGPSTAAVAGAATPAAFQLPVHFVEMLYQIGEVRDALRRLEPGLEQAVRGEILRKVKKLVQSHIKKLKTDPDAQILHPFNTAAGLMDYIAKRSGHGSGAASKEAAPKEAASEEVVEAAEMAEDEAEDEAAFVELGCSAFITPAASKEAASKEAASEEVVEAAEMAEDEAEDEAAFVELGCSSFITPLSAVIRREEVAAAADELGKARSKIAQHARLWQRADERVKKAEAWAEEQSLCAKAAAREALAQRARANELQMRVDAVPPVATGFAARAPAFAHGSRYGFHGAQSVRGGLEADRLAQKQHTHARENKQLQQKLSECRSELKRWRWDPGAELAANVQCEAARVQEAEAQIREAKVQKAEATRMWMASHNTQSNVNSMQRAIATDRAAAATDRTAAAAARMELDAAVDLLRE
jgi:hypothetical protein